MMTPFILWLNTEEVDEILTTLLLTKSKTENEDNVMNSEGLLKLAQNLLNQNKSLIKIVQKIEPMSPIHKNSANIYGADQKCKHYKKELIRMYNHCSNHNSKQKNKLEDISKLICNDCPRISESNHPFI